MEASKEDGEVGGKGKRRGIAGGMKEGGEDREWEGEGEGGEERMERMGIVGG